MAVIVYLNAKQRAEVKEERVTIKDLATIYCKEAPVQAKVKSLAVCQLSHAGKQDRKVISTLYLIQLIETECPGTQVENLGETDVIVALETARRATKWRMALKLLLVSCISFFGTMLTIMAYHNDIGIEEMFAKLYEQVMGEASNGYTVLELAYSVGLGAGILIFFNHFGTKRITRDATPIEVEMRVYETDVNKALIETAEREEQSIEPS